MGSFFLCFYESACAYAQVKISLNYFIWLLDDQSCFFIPCATNQGPMWGHVCWLKWSFITWLCSSDYIFVNSQNSPEFRHDEQKSARTSMTNLRLPIAFLKHWHRFGSTASPLIKTLSTRRTTKLSKLHYALNTFYFPLLLKKLAKALALPIVRTERSLRCPRLPNVLTSPQHELLLSWIT